MQMTRWVFLVLCLGSCLRTRRIWRRFSATSTSEKRHDEPSPDDSRFEKAYELTRSFCEALEEIEKVRRDTGVHDPNTFDDVSSVLQQNPFLFCDVGWSDLAKLSEWSYSVMQHAVNKSLQLEDEYIADALGLDDELVESKDTPPVLEFLGKKAKGGMFWKTPALVKGFLLKTLKTEEIGVLKKLIPMGSVATEYADCEAFQGTLLQPVLLSFLDDASGVDYIVMRDETMRLQETAGKDWEVRSKWDIKPLPNLSDDLPTIIQELLMGNGVLTSKLNLWKGWDSVRGALQKSVNILHHADVVDYSLFIHLLTAKVCDGGACVTETPALGSQDGCMFQPKGESFDVIICFKVIDFLTPLTYMRELESAGKGYKFADYSDKFMNAFDCLKDLQHEKCQAYLAYRSVKLSDGTVDTPNVAFVRSSLFASTYECAVDLPKMRWVSALGMGGINFLRAPDIHTFPEVIMHSHLGYHRNYAEWLQLVASEADIVKDEFSRHLRGSYHELVNASLEEFGAKHPMTTKQLDACDIGVKKFATQSWFFRGNKNKELQNVLWHADKKELFVVRGKPTLSSYSDWVKDMRFNECFLSTRLIRCRPVKSWTVRTNYTTSFGALEILQIRPGRLSPEYTPWEQFEYGRQ